MRVLDLKMPVIRTTSVVFASPHSGRAYAREFVKRSILDERTLRSSEDALVDKLFASAPDHGAPLLSAVVPRAWIDVNRSVDELDPNLIEGLRDGAHNPRVASGLGVVPRVVANGKSIYRGKIALDEARERIDEVWHPWHETVSVLMDESMALFGEAILVDCHSMPHEAIDTIPHPRGARPEIVLGDRFGTAAASDLVDQIEAAFAAAGLNVARNAPFAGAFATQRYGHPLRNRHVVQIEIDRSLYLDERTVRPNGNYRTFRKLIDGVVAEIVGIGCKDMSVAAE
jgi:N-formylglutamate amidohydrolase